MGHACRHKGRDHGQQEDPDYDRSGRNEEGGADSGGVEGMFPVHMGEGDGGLPPPLGGKGGILKRKDHAGGKGGRKNDKQRNA